MKHLLLLLAWLLAIQPVTTPETVTKDGWEVVKVTDHWIS